MLKQKINPMSAETEKTSLTAEASQKPPEQAPKEGEAEEEEQSECAACCQNNIAKILFLFLIIIYTWSAEEVFIFTRTTKIAIIMDRLKGGERERFMVNLANRFVNTRTLHCYFLTNQPEKFEYTLDPKVGRVNVFKGKNRDWSFINKFIRENEIKMIFYNGYDANEMKALQSFGKPVVFFNHDTYFTQLAYNHNFDYFKFFNRSKGVVNFIPPEIKHFQEYGHKNVISMHKPIAYDFFDVKPVKLI